MIMILRARAAMSFFDLTRIVGMNRKKKQTTTR
jgi:hypothetical protein